MKKIILIAFAFLLTGVVHAQNKMWISGMANFRNYSGENDYSETGGSFSPGFGYSLNSKFAVGIGLTVEGNTIKDEVGNTDVETKISEFSVAPFFRYYKSLVENKCALYGELNVAFGSGKSEYDNGTDTMEDTYGFFQTKIAPGIQYWVHDNWSINAEWGALSYRAENDKADEDGEEDQTSSEINVGLDMSAISFGVNFHF